MHLTELPERVVARPIHTNRGPGDRAFRAVAVAAGASTLVIMSFIGIFLLVRAMPALRSAGWSFLTEFAWRPDETTPVFGIGAIMYGTALIAAIALLEAIPVSIATALFITDYCPLALRRTLTGLVDLLAAVPSLIYGLWGLFFLQPRMLGLSRFLTEHLGFIPIFKTTSVTFVSSSPLIAGTVVALMIVPIATSVMREVFAQAPVAEREAALALGGTRWAMVRAVVVPFGRGGMVGGSMLGLGRALGETIAVAIIISPIFTISGRVLQTGGNSVASLIALKFGESKQLGLSALMAAGLALFGVTLLVNMIAASVVSRSRSGAGVEI